MKKFSLMLLTTVAFLAAPGSAQSLSPTKTYTEEWVYRVKLGHQDEWWQIFQRYQVPELDALKKTGDVVSYSIYRANLHTDEAARWDYRIIVIFKDFATVGALIPREEQLLKTLFPDVAARKAGEMRRWDLTLNHWDLPIVEVEPHG
ncbi:hypothetical protein KZX46_10705 [Polymorphobacter sp. PAMC 29334]|uniref:hypothetical protein n=1 Tax=Polymorphobacter sp. PAMC 29334 TaxID=2862331 RepID=UPI001C774698|nr:hypothetical protein [Polymorphobacter sp. PAMC 29334]QYE36349.1 hypothetical protein KZX46_10705 [Polymorphobacter sp. PAMC 29334]